MKKLLFTVTCFAFLSFYAPINWPYGSADVQSEVSVAADSTVTVTVDNRFTYVPVDTLVYKTVTVNTTATTEKGAFLYYNVRAVDTTTIIIWGTGITGQNDTISGGTEKNFSFISIATGAYIPVGSARAD